MVPGLAMASLTKSMLQIWFRALATTRGRRTPIRLIFLRFLMANPSWRYSLVGDNYLGRLTTNMLAGLRPKPGGSGRWG